MDFIKQNWQWFVLGAFYVFNEVVQALRKDADNSITIRILVAVRDAVAKFLSIIPGVNLDRPVGPKVENPFSRSTAPGWLVLVMVTAAALSLSACAGAYQKSVSAFGAAHMGARLAQRTVIGLCGRRQLSDETCEDFIRVSDRLKATDEALLALFETAEATRAAIAAGRASKDELDAVLGEIAPLLEQYLELAGALQRLAAEIKTREAPDATVPVHSFRTAAVLGQFARR